MQYTHIWLPLFATGVQCPSREAAPCRLLLSSTTVEHRSAHTPSRCPGQHMSASISLQIQTKYQLISIHTRPILLPAASTSLPNQTSTDQHTHQANTTTNSIHFSANPDKTSLDQYTHQANTNSSMHLHPFLCQPRYQPISTHTKPTPFLCQPRQIIN